MKKLVLFFLLIGSVSASAQSDSLYNRANAHYEGGEYEAALDAYGQLIASGYESSDLYYNMGNAAFRSNSIGLSILYYEKALKLEPGNQDAAHNLEYVKQYRVDAFDSIPVFFLKNWIRAFVHLLSERSWSLAALLLFSLFFICVLLYLFSRRMVLKKAGFFIGLAVLLLFGLSLASAVSAHRQIVRPVEAVIIEPSVTVRSTPDHSGTELFILHEGTKVTSGEMVSGWQNIRVADGREGWVVQNHIASI